MNCQTCNAPTKKAGKDRKGHQRFQCLACKKTFIEDYERPLGDMRLPMEKALSIIQHLVEGCSIRTTERITGVGKQAILALLEFVGERCETLMENRIKGLAVSEVQADEIWGFVGMKQKTKHFQGRDDDDTLGDAYCFIGIERNTKVILAWHLGNRTEADTVCFTEKLAHATRGSFQITTDGFKPYQHAVVMSLGAQHVDFAQLVKLYTADREGEARYSPADCTGAKKVPIFGDPDKAKISTSHIERQNLTVRMSMRRMTRLTNAFSKKWMNLKYSYALHFAHYNFCKVHSSLRVTPAMEAGITDHIWSLSELLTD